ncbi:MAG TPA: hypothetical protein VFT74_16145 [Isosphaeraceae bacterium]|nr:hypothetical protein [Isosphaeraceae bacterium]
MADYMLPLTEEQARLLRKALEMKVEELHDYGTPEQERAAKHLASKLDRLVKRKTYLVRMDLVVAVEASSAEDAGRKAKDDMLASMWHPAALRAISLTDLEEEA